MKIRAGYEISYDCPQPTPMILTLSVHPSRGPDLLTADRMRLDPAVPVTRYSPRLDMSNVGPAAEVFRRYLGLLAKAGYQETKGWPYAYGAPGASDGSFRWLHRSRGDR